MKKLLSYTMIALLATIAVSIAAPDKDEMMAKEKAAWQAFKDKNADDFKKVVDHDMVGVYAEGIANMAKEMADMQEVGHEIVQDQRLQPPSRMRPDVMVTSYKVTLEGTYDGKDASGTYNAGSVWKMENGKWLAIFHTNVLQAGPALTRRRKNSGRHQISEAASLSGRAAFRCVDFPARVLF